MALHRHMELVENEVVTAALPMSGPYSLSGPMRNLLVEDSPYGFVAYLASSALSFQAAYGNIFSNGKISDLFKPMYAELVEQYANEELDLFDLNQALIELLISEVGSSIPHYMIYDSIYQQVISDDNHPINVALRDNDVYDLSLIHI